jgi:hypothetical protein
MPKTEEKTLVLNAERKRPFPYSYATFCKY